jgi:polyhydroxybutyrate depolymerase
LGLRSRCLLAVVAGVFCLLGSVSAFAAQRIERSLVVDGLTRQYVMWIPDGAPSREPLPVVLAFHGGGGSVEALEDNSQLQAAKEAANFLIVFPVGYDRTFNVGGYCCGSAARQNIDDVKFVRALLADVGSVVKFDRRRVYSTGFSNGGQFSYYLACHMPDVIAAIASVSGAMQPPFDTCRPGRAIPVMHWEGLADRFDPFEGGRSLVRTAPPQPPTMAGIDLWRRLDGTRETRPVDIAGPGAQCTQSTGAEKDAIVVLCLVPGLGHQWPGDNHKPGSRRVLAQLGPFGPPMDVNDAILTFFSRYSLP